MAFSTGPIVGNAASDNPTFVVENVCEPAAVPTTPSSRWSNDDEAGVGGTFSGTDRTDANFPVRRAYDRFRHLPTRPSSAVPDDVYHLVLRAERPTKPAQSQADASILLIDGHNFDLVTNGVGVRVQTADDDAFTSNLTTIHDFGTVTTSGRLLAVLTTEYLNLERIRVRLQADMNFGSGAGYPMPQIGEVFFGPRIVLERQPNLPWDEEHLFSDVGRFKSRNGVISTYLRYEGQRIARATFQPDSSSEISDLREAFELGGHGSKPFLFIDNPQTDPVGYMMVRDADNDMPLQGPFDRLLTIDMEEQAPFVATE